MGRSWTGPLGSVFGALLLFGSLMITTQPAAGITGGQRDEVHTNVGVVRFTTEAGRFRCSGTLISPTVVLTAGHCTGDTGDSPATNLLRLLQYRPATRPAGSRYHAGGERCPRRELHHRHRTSDPGWDGKLSISKQHDQGVVVLDAPAATKWPGITPAPLLPVGTLDGNQGALKNQTFTLVGYGVDIGAKKSQIVVPEAALHHVVPQDGAERGRHFPDQRPRLQGRRRLLFGRLRWAGVPRPVRGG